MIGDYTLPQIEAFLAAVSSEERARDRMALLLNRAAQADEKQFKKIIKELGNGQ